MRRRSRARVFVGVFMKVFVRMLVLAAVAAVVAEAWRRWRGPWPVKPQPAPASRTGPEHAETDPNPTTSPDTGAAAEAETRSATAVEAPIEAAHESGPDTGDWVEPQDDGSCPPSHPVKANQSGIYHLPGGRFYDRTTPERCYRTPEAAERDGYRRAKA